MRLFDRLIPASLCVLIALAAIMSTGCKSWWVDPAAYDVSSAPPDFSLEVHIYPPAPMSEDDLIFAPENGSPDLPPAPNLAGLADTRPMVYILHPDRRLLIAQPSHQGAIREIVARTTITPDQFNEVFALVMQEDLVEAETSEQASKTTPESAHEGLFDVLITAYNKTNYFRATVPESKGTTRLATLLAKLSEPRPGGY